MFISLLKTKISSFIESHRTSKNDIELKRINVRQLKHNIINFQQN